MRFVMPFSHDPHTRGFSQSYRVSVHTNSRFIPTQYPITNWESHKTSEGALLARHDYLTSWLSRLHFHRPIRELKDSDNAALLPNSYPTEEQFRLSKCDHLCFTHRLSHTHPRNPSANWREGLGSAYSVHLWPAARFTLIILWTFGRHFCCYTNM